MVLERQSHSVKISGELLNIGENTDDNMILSDTMESLDKILRIKEEKKATVLKMILKKMVFSRAEHPKDK